TQQPHGAAESPPYLPPIGMSASVAAIGACPGHPVLINATAKIGAARRIGCIFSSPIYAFIDLQEQPAVWTGEPSAMAARPAAVHRRRAAWPKSLGAGSQ